MNVLTDASIIELILKFSDMRRDVSRRIAFAREIEAMVLKEVFKRIQPEEKK